MKIGDLVITGLWARATPPRAPTGGGYLTIANTGTEPDALIAVASPLAGKAEIHRMEMKDGVMVMRPVAGGIEIPPGGSVALAPGGLHVMFMELKGALTKGEKLPLTLRFRKAGEIATFLDIEPIGAAGPGDSHAHGATETGEGQ